jgi:beta-1,4-N-acetylglucosaminyltransferase
MERMVPGKLFCPHKLHPGNIIPTHRFFPASYLPSFPASLFTPWSPRAKFVIIFLMKLAMVCSSGGHLLLLHLLKDFWGQYDRFWVTFKKEDAVSLLEHERIYWAFFPTNRNFLNLFRNFFVALKVLFKEKPDVIISSGAGVAIPFFYLGKLLRKKLVFIEAYERVENPSLTGRLVYPLTDVFILHWEEQKKSYPKGKILGELL